MIHNTLLGECLSSKNSPETGNFFLQFAAEEINVAGNRKDRDINIGKNLKKLREIMCLKQKDLGKMSGLSSVQISHFETGEKGIGVKSRLKLAKAFCVPLEEFDRMLASDGDERRLRLSLAIYRTDISDLAEPFLDMIELKKMAEEHKLSEDAWDHLLRQIKMLVRLSKSALDSEPFK